MAYLDSSAGNNEGGAVHVKAMTFTEVGAGTYTQSVTVPAGSYLLDIQVHAVALWNAGTSASLEVGDAVDPDGYFTAVDLKATDLLADQGITFALQGGVGGAYMVSTHTTNIYDATDRVVTASVVSAGSGSTGRTRVIVVYATPETTTEAAFVAA